jgi:hypothetical protein
MNLEWRVKHLEGAKTPAAASPQQAPAPPVWPPPPGLALGPWPPTAAHCS